MGIGRPQAFATQTRKRQSYRAQGSDTAPPTPIDSVYEEFNTFNELLLKKLQVQTLLSVFLEEIDNIQHMTITDTIMPFCNGSTSSVQTLNSATTLFDSNFYVMTDDFNVYKCLDNNSDAASTAKPTHINIYFINWRRYKWKYMYTLSASQQTNFLSTDFMQLLLIQPFHPLLLMALLMLLKLKLLPKH